MLADAFALLVPVEEDAPVPVAPEDPLEEPVELAELLAAPLPPKLVQAARPVKEKSISVTRARRRSFVIRSGLVAAFARVKASCLRHAAQ